MTTNETLNLKKEQADKILSEINTKHLSVIKIKESCDELFKSIQSSSGENKKVNSTLNQIKRRSDTLLIGA